PEQLDGKEVTAKSDIYALGLVLYEIFSGKRAFEAETLGELIKLQETRAPASLAALVRDIDPAVERAILRCLTSDPRNRPPSALAVAAALPGGDPVAAALAAGETPSPAMVAASGRMDAVPLRIGLGVMAAILVGLAVLIGLRGRAAFARYVPADMSGPVLDYRA